MFVIVLTYKVAAEAVDVHLDAHKAWLDQGYATGMLLAAGRQVPRTGGVLLARGERAAVEVFAARDPFVVNGVADYSLIEFEPTRTAPGLEALTQ